MRLRTFSIESTCLAVVLLAGLPAARADLTQTQTQTVSADPNGAVTNWGPGTNNITNPLTFTQFNPSLGTLKEIDLTLNTSIHNNYFASFAGTPTTIQLFTSLNQSPDTGGPFFRVLGPDHTTELLSESATAQPPDTRTVQASSGQYSSLNAPDSPFYIQPTNTSTVFGPIKLQPGDPLFSQFIGSGTVGLPVYSFANSSFSIISGNGTGEVLTTTNAGITLQYFYSIPEPSSIVLLGLGAGFTILTIRSSVRKKTARA